MKMKQRSSQNEKKRKYVEITGYIRCCRFFLFWLVSIGCLFFTIPPDGDDNDNNKKINNNNNNKSASSCERRRSNK
jgi:hypothetical protein